MKVVKFTSNMADILRVFCNEYWPENEETQDSFFMDYYQKDSILKALDEGKSLPYYLAMDGDKCVGYFYHQTYHKYDVFSLGHFLDGMFAKAFPVLIKMFPNMMLEIHDYLSMEESKILDENNIKRINSKASFMDGEEVGEYESFSNWYSVDGKSDVVEFVESKFFPEIDVNSLSFSVLNGEQLFDFMKTKMFQVPDGYPLWCGGKVVGFHYLCMNNLHRGFGFSDEKSDIKFLIAHHEGTLVGCICFGVWPNSQDHQSLSFIDVAVPYRNKGVAKMMAKEIDKHLDPNLPFVLTDESEMGAKCGIANIFKNSITTTSVMKYREYYAYY